MVKISQACLNNSESLKISFAPLCIEDVYKMAESPENGAVVIMSGTVRNQTEGQAVRYLEYQAYEPMAINIFRLICDRIYSQWQETKTIIIHHRIGKLSIGDISVLVAVGCPHRTEAFEACRYAIDTLKHNAPIWKKEHFIDGATSWVSIGACEEFAHQQKLI